MVAAANDLTKLFEKIERGTLASLLAKVEGVTLKGEYIVVIGGASDKQVEASEQEDDEDA